MIGDRGSAEETLERNILAVKFIHLPRRNNDRTNTGTDFQTYKDPQF